MVVLSRRIYYAWKQLTGGEGLWPRAWIFGFKTRTENFDWRAD